MCNSNEWKISNDLNRIWLKVLVRYIVPVVRPFVKRSTVFKWEVSQTIS